MAFVLPIDVFACILQPSHSHLLCRNEHFLGAHTFQQLLEKHLELRLNNCYYLLSKKQVASNSHQFLHESQDAI